MLHVDGVDTFLFILFFLISQLLLFATANDSEKVVPAFQEAAKSFKGKVINFKIISNKRV